MIQFDKFLRIMRSCHDKGKESRIFVVFLYINDSLDISIVESSLKDFTQTYPIALIKH